MASESVEAQDIATANPVIEAKKRKRRIITFVVVTLLNVGLLTLLLTQLLTPQSSQQNNAPVASQSGDAGSPLLGTKAPDFNLPVLGKSSQQVHLADLKGKVVLVNFWASWCEPCQQEAAFLQQTWTRLQPKGVVMIGVDGPEYEVKAQEFVDHYGITYTNVRDTAGGETSLNYGATANPETFFINENGVIVGRWIGPLTEKGLQSELAKVHITLDK